MGEAAKIIQEAQKSGLFLTATETGTIKARGPSDVLARFKPAIATYKGEILAVLSGQTPKRPQTSAPCPQVSAPRLDWWTAPVEGWREGFLVIRNIVRQDETVIRFRSGDG